jgi:hypothetical protein
LHSSFWSWACAWLRVSSRVFSQELSQELSQKLSRLWSGVSCLQASSSHLLEHRPRPLRRHHSVSRSIKQSARSDPPLSDETHCLALVLSLALGRGFPLRLLPGLAAGWNNRDVVHFLVPDRLRGLSDSQLVLILLAHCDKTYCLALGRGFPLRLLLGLAAGWNPPDVVHFLVPDRLRGLSDSQLVPILLVPCDQTHCLALAFSLAFGIRLSRSFLSHERLARLAGPGEHVVIRENIVTIILTIIITQGGESILSDFDVVISESELLPWRLSFR